MVKNSASLKKILESRELNTLQKVLDEKGVSQYRLHKDSGVSYALINGYCQNKSQPSLETLYRLAITLEVNPKDLINS